MPLTLACIFERPKSAAVGWLVARFASTLAPLRRGFFFCQTSRSSPRFCAWYDVVRAEGAFMPHYFFDLTDEKIIHDFKGKQLRDLKQAREHALIIAREVVTTKATLLREPISDWSVTVKDGKFQKLFSVPITDAMPQPD